MNVWLHLMSALAFGAMAFFGLKWRRQRDLLRLGWRGTRRVTVDKPGAYLRRVAAALQVPWEGQDEFDLPLRRLLAQKVIEGMADPRLVRVRWRAARAEDRLGQRTTRESAPAGAIAAPFSVPKAVTSATPKAVVEIIIKGSPSEALTWHWGALGDDVAIVCTCVTEGESDNGT